jgi:hypothetical protein
VPLVAPAVPRLDASVTVDRLDLVDGERHRVAGLLSSAGDWLELTAGQRVFAAVHHGDGDIHRAQRGVGVGGLRGSGALLVAVVVPSPKSQWYSVG